MRRLAGDIYHLESSEGWEGVGILDGSVYRGVFHSRRGSEKSAGGRFGDHAIDWTVPDDPVIRSIHDAASDETSQSWHRIAISTQALPQKRAASRVPSNIVVAPPEPGSRPAFGEYVYVEELPEAVSKVQPVFPNEARARGIDGVVMVQALVLEDGSVGDCRVVKSIPGLDEAAVACVRQWRFKPALSKGKPVAVWVAVPVRFAR